MKDQSFAANVSKRANTPDIGLIKFTREEEIATAAIPSRLRKWVFVKTILEFLKSLISLRKNSNNSNMT